jgi:uncharacterized radical SAM superfamily Fe-S cluster-containing enzyme
MKQEGKGKIPGGGSTAKRTATYLGMTRSTCPHCLSLVNARIEAEDNKVYFNKYCPSHGPSRALISEDAEYYLKTREYAMPGTIPHRFATDVENGCPDDCGLCPDHQQHTCHPIVEVTEECNLNCPTCIVNKRHPDFLPVESFTRLLDNLVESEGRLENLTLSGGEATLHPRLWDLIDAADRPEIARVSIATNGLRIAEDEEFCRRLKEKNVYVLLQWDGFDDDIYQKLRGAELLEIKERALANLVNHGVTMQLICAAAAGINDHQLGRIVQLMLDHENILSLGIQPMALPAYLAQEKDAALEHITIPGVIRALAEQVPGLLRKEDFIPLPCPNPECVSLTYLLRLDNGGYAPFPRFTDMKNHLGLLSQSATIEPGPETEESLQDIINELWSSAGEVPDSECISGALRRALEEIFAKSKDQRDKMRMAERQAKSIFIHHYMDPHTFDLARAFKCCHHYIRADGKIMPMCAFNMFHRKNEENPFVIGT